MKTYLTSIKRLQTFLLFISILVLLVLPEALVFFPDAMGRITDGLYTVAHTMLFFVMVIRPLADMLRGVSWIRPLVILRKGVGVLSASIIVSFIIAKVMVAPYEYLGDVASYSYWSLNNLALFAHLADISAVLLLITSNNLSKKLLDTNWKRLQRLSYVYFYGSGIYVLSLYGGALMGFYLITVTLLTTTAYILNRRRALTPHHG